MAENPPIPLSQRLRTKAAMMCMGEKIAWGSETALMAEAADALEAATNRQNKLRKALEDLCKAACEYEQINTPVLSVALNKAMRALRSEHPDVAQDEQIP
jgi:hypothetical protein